MRPSHHGLFAALVAITLVSALSPPRAAAAASDLPMLMTATVQVPEPLPLPKEVDVLWMAALGAIGSVILGIVKFFTNNLAKLPDWAKGVIALVLPSVVAFIAHFFGYASLPPDLVHAVPLLAAGAIGMGLRALVKVLAPKVSAMTVQTLAS